MIEFEKYSQGLNKTQHRLLDGYKIPLITNYLFRQSISHNPFYDMLNVRKKKAQSKI